MIEIEKKFILSEKQKKMLIKGAEFLGEKIFTDTYYDTKEYALTKNDIWLRSREGHFELKLPMQKNALNVPNKYDEIEGEEKIRQVFDVAPERSFLEDIRAFGYGAFCKLRTKRKKYRKGKFSIDFDKVSSKGFKYLLCEIEIMVEKQEEMEKAGDEIIAFAESFGIENRNIRGKVLEYLLQKKPDHYRALVDAGVVIE